MKTGFILICAATLLLSAEWAGAQNKSSDSSTSAKSTTTSDPLAPPKVKEEDLSVPESGKGRKLHFHKNWRDAQNDDSSSDSSASSSAPAKKKKKITRAKLKPTDLGNTADTNTLEGRAPSGPIKLGVPMMQTSVYDMPPLPAKKNPAVLGLTFSSWQPSHFTATSNLNNTSQFDKSGLPELTLFSQMNLGMESWPHLSWVLGLSYEHLSRTGILPMPGYNSTQTQEMTMITPRVGLINEFQVRALGENLRPFVGVDLTYTWATATSDAFNNGIADSYLGDAEKVGLSYHGKSWQALLGAEVRSGIGSGDINGSGIFAGFSTSLE